MEAGPPPAEGAEELEPFLWATGTEGWDLAGTSGLYPPPEAPPKPSRGQRVRRLAWELTETLILALLIFLAVRAAFQNFRVEGSSMDPSLHNSQLIIVNKAIYTRINLEPISRFIPFFDAGDNPIRYLFRRPRRGDVVVFRFPQNPDKTFIKRIIGEPGDTVEVKGGTVYIDGAPLDEPYIVNKPTYTYCPEEVPPKHYFVLGDNRNNSRDSRSWGFLPEENIIGQASLSYWPQDYWGLVPNKKLSPQAP
jgi:signal peptidase I